MRPGRNGLLVPPDDEAGLTEALVTVLSDRHHAAALGAAARRNALQYLGKRGAAVAEVRRRLEALVARG